MNRRVQPANAFERTDRRILSGGTACRVTLLLLVTAAVAVALASKAFFGPRTKLVINPDTADGQFLQLIELETDESRKLSLLEAFVNQFPRHESVGWVYMQMQLAYVNTGQFDKALDAGARVLALDADNVEAAQENIKAAEGKKDPALVKKWSATAAEAAQSVINSPVPANVDEMEAWKKRVESARQWLGNVEYSLYTAALHNPDPRKKLELLDEFCKRNPQTQYLKQAQLLYFITYRQIGDAKRALSTAEKILEKDATNEDVLLYAAEAHLQRNSDSGKVVSYSNAILELMQTKPKPQGVSDADWQRQKAQLSGHAHFMIGSTYMSHDQYSQADKSLRTALPLSRHSDQLTAAILNYLGWANYKLKNFSEARRFYNQCIVIKSPYQGQALQNLAAIKSENP